MAKTSIPEYFLGKKVTDFWNAGGGWAWQTIESLLANSTFLKNGFGGLKRNSEAEDLQVWGMSQMGDLQLVKPTANSTPMRLRKVELVGK